MKSQHHEPIANPCSPTDTAVPEGRGLGIPNPLPQPAPDFPIGSMPATIRKDGWTPAARRTFLEVLAETGRVKLACDICRMTTQSAYALRARDPVFAASWDAACEIARQPLADALYERAVSGVTETITRDGKVIATRHRHDNRLSMAVLQRLDTRCEKSWIRGARHMPLLANWDEWLDRVEAGDDLAAHDAFVMRGPHRQLHQLPLGKSPTRRRRAPEQS